MVEKADPRDDSAAKARLLTVAQQAIADCHAFDLTRKAVSDLPALAAAPVHLLAMGKAAVAMAMGARVALQQAGAQLAGGLLVTKPEVVNQRSGEDLSASLRPLRLMYGSHPTPDARSAVAGRALLDYLAGVPAAARVVALVSGGTSSLIATPRPGGRLSAMARLSERLLASGRPIAQVNAERQALSCVAAGGLAAASRADIEVMVLSDVLGDDLGVVGSGPFWRGAAAEPGGARVQHHLIANHRTLLLACERAAREAGYGTIIHCQPDEDEVALGARRWLARLAAAPSPCLFIGGGEATVSLPERAGRGGRNHHLALLMARGLAGYAATFLALASDGDDGNSGAAGAVVDGRSWTAMTQRLDPARALRTADSQRALAAIGASIAAANTGTNLLDLHLLLVGG
ncbi:MAG TPA: DUF4147 domain-containing protein [Sorangium sp.]|nr:DUF4147 domain-containing protein [Sorangium sp.]